MLFTCEGQEHCPQTDQVPPAAQTTRRFPAISTICCHDIIGRGISSSLRSPAGIPCTNPSAYSGNITSVAHLDADCPNVRRCQQMEIAFYIAITYCFLKGRSFSIHAAHWDVLWRKEHPDVFRTKHCFLRNGQKHLNASRYPEHVSGAEMLQEILLPATTESPPRCKACYCTQVPQQKPF